MRLDLRHYELLDALRRCAPFCSTRGPNQIFQYTLLECRDGVVTVASQDMESGIKRVIGKCDEDVVGSVLLHNKSTISVLSAVDVSVVTLDYDGSTLTLSGPGFRYGFQSPDVDTYPCTPNVASDKYYRVNGSRFKRLGSRVLPAAERAYGRYSALGVRFESGEDHIRLVATDGRQLATQTIVASPVGCTSLGDSIRISHEAAARLMRSVPNGDVDIVSQDNLLCVSGESVFIWTRLMEGRFPNWRSVFPDGDAQIVWGTNAGRLARLLQQAAVICGKPNAGVTITIYDGKATLSSRGASSETSEVTTEIDGVNGEMKIRVDPDLFVACLEGLGDTDIVVNLFGQEQPLVVETFPGEVNEGEFKYVIMPLVIAIPSTIVHE